MIAKFNPALIIGVLLVGSLPLVSANIRCSSEIINSIVVTEVQSETKVPDIEGVCAGIQAAFKCTDIDGSCIADVDGKIRWTTRVDGSCTTDDLELAWWMGTSNQWGYICCTPDCTIR